MPNSDCYYSCNYYSNVQINEIKLFYNNSFIYQIGWNQ